MKPFITLVLYLLPTICLINAQSTVSLSGTLSGNQGQCYLFTETKYVPIEPSVQGKYQLELTVTQMPTAVQLGGISPKGQIEYYSPQIWIGQREVEIDFRLSDGKATWTSSAPYEHQDLSQQIEEASKKDQLSLITNHIQTPPARYFLYDNRLDYSPADIENALSKLPDDQPQDQYLDFLSTYLIAKSLAKPQKGNPFPDFQVLNAQGQPEGFQSRSDRPTVLAYMASGCGFSVYSVPSLAEIQEQYEGRFRLVTVWDDRNEEAFTSSPDQKKHIAWQNLWDKNGLLSPWLGRPATPSYYLINPEGELEKVVVGTGKLRKALSKWL